MNLNIVLAIAAFCVGLWAAYFWYKASTIQIDNPLKNVVLGEGAEMTQLVVWTVSTMEAFTKSAELNKVAARWTALAVVLSAALAFVGLLK